MFTLKWPTAILMWTLLMAGSVWAQDLKVKITPSMGWADVTHSGQKIRIQRIQDPSNKIADDLAKTSRPCPDYCIQPLTAAPGVETLAELELLDFMTHKVADGSGLVIDTRLAEYHKLETIPTSISIPFTVIKADNPHLDLILSALGAEMGKNKTWEFQRAKTLVLWCNGPWCDQSARAIKVLLQLGYPSAKLKYYRGGMQAWKHLGLTTVVAAPATH